MPRRDYGICIVCNRRKARRIQKTCDPCHALIEAEGTHEQHGLSKGSLTRQRWREQSAEYNKLIREGWSQRQVAQHFGVNCAQLRCMVYRWKIKAGIKVVPGWGNERLTRATAAPSTALVQKKSNEHGGGRWGVTGCNCDLCLATRRQSRRLANARYRKRLKERREAAKKNIS
jgi:hypothetical protein